MSWGIQTWNDKGEENNDGIVPTFVLGYTYINNEVNSGSWSFNKPSDMTLTFLCMPLGNENETGGNFRRIIVNNNEVSMTIGDGKDVNNDYPPGDLLMVFYLS